MNYLTYLFVGLGGALGAMSRVALSSLFPSFVKGIPIKIICINVLGCLMLGIVTTLMGHYGNPSSNVRHLLIQGFLGGFTTFSAFALDFALLFEKGSYLLGFLYVFLSVVLSITFFFLGLKIIRI